MLLILLWKKSKYVNRTISVTLLLVPLVLAGCGDEGPDMNRVKVISAPTPQLTAAPSSGTVNNAAASDPNNTPTNPTARFPPSSGSLTSTLAPSQAPPVPVSMAASNPAAAIDPPTPSIRVAPLKPGVLLEPMTWEAQTWNNCGPVSAQVALSYYNIKLSQVQCAKALRPNSSDKLVRPDELLSFIQKQGLQGAWRENGSLDKLRALLSAGFPVITEQWLKENDEIAHYRVARGYDLAADTFFFNDSMDRKPNTTAKSAYQDKLWKGFNRRYIVVFRPEQEGAVMAILGEDAQPAENLRRGLEAASKEVQLTPKEVDAWSNLGYMRYAAGDCRGALDVWEQNIKKMLKPNEYGPFNYYLWYQLWPVECYNKLGNYRQVIEIAPNEISKAVAFAEMRYQFAVALLNTGRKEEAVTQLKRALLDDPNYGLSTELLVKLGV
jgi:tetratricopeptide (TPR) repeat protein